MIASLLANIAKGLKVKCQLSTIIQVSKVVCGKQVKLKHTLFTVFASVARGTVTFIGVHLINAQPIVETGRRFTFINI